MKLAEQDDEKFVVSLEGFEDDFNRTIWYSSIRIDYEEDDDEDEYDFDVDEELESADLEDIEDYFFTSL